MRPFFDANTLFTAAHNPHGKAALVIDLGVEGYWKLFTSAYAIEEARRNLEAKFPAALPRFAELIAHFGIAPEHRGGAAPTTLPAKDRPIYLAALACRATHLLTGDLRDFGSLMNKPEETGGLVIQTVSEFLSRSLSRVSRADWSWRGDV
jgi:predicted nucleic acid-binding protein